MKQTIAAISSRVPVRWKIEFDVMYISFLLLLLFSFSHTFMGILSVMYLTCWSGRAATLREIAQVFLHSKRKVFILRFQILNTMGVRMTAGASALQVIPVSAY
jgi:hypothetical protein